MRLETKLKITYYDLPHSFYSIDLYTIVYGDNGYMLDLQLVLSKHVCSVEVVGIDDNERFFISISNATREYVTVDKIKCDHESHLMLIQNLHDDFNEDNDALLATLNKRIIVEY